MIRTFATLSPVPKFRQWVERRLPSAVEPLDGAPGAFEPGMSARDVALRRLLDGDLPADAAASEALQAYLMPLCLRYLVLEKQDALPVDRVARFHFGSGARLDRIDWLANPSPRGMQESLGIMVNYVCEPSEIESNHEAYFRDGKVATSSGVRRWLRKTRDDGAAPDRAS